MNVESILEKINLFNELVIKSGYKRDISDYRQSIAQAQNQNMTFMKGYSQKIQAFFLNFEKNALQDELKIILKDTQPFTELKTIEILKEIDNDPEIQANTYLQELAKLLDALIQGVADNEKELDTAQSFFTKYISDMSMYKSEDEQALISLIFKDFKSTGNLLEFSKVLKRWDKTLLLYHRLVKSNSPEQVSLQAIQNGSIDVIVNMDINVAIDLTDVIKTGLYVFGAYLSYKTELAQNIIKSYMGNEALIAQEDEREKLMFENIKEAVKRKIQEQHTIRLEADPNIDNTSIKKKIEEVSSIVVEHIIKGNEVKLLTQVEIEDSENEDETIDISKELRNVSSIVRQDYKKIDNTDRQKLLEAYTVPDTDS